MLLTFASYQSAMLDEERVKCFINQILLSIVNKHEFHYCNYYLNLIKYTKLIIIIIIHIPIIVIVISIIGNTR